MHDFCKIYPKKLKIIHVFLSSPFPTLLYLSSHISHLSLIHKCMVTLYISQNSYHPMNTSTILAISAIFAGAILSITGFSVTISVVAQMTADNATMGNMSGGDMSGGDMSGGNMTGRIVDCGPSQGQSC
jgi:hypothetical protein